MLTGGMSAKFAKWVGRNMGSNIRPRYVQFRGMHNHDISGVHCIKKPNTLYTSNEAMVGTAEKVNADPCLIDNERYWHTVGWTDNDFNKIVVVTKLTFYMIMICNPCINNSQVIPIITNVICQHLTELVHTWHISWWGLWNIHCKSWTCKNVNLVTTAIWLHICWVRQPSKTDR